MKKLNKMQWRDRYAILSKIMFAIYPFGLNMDTMPDNEPVIRTAITGNKSEVIDAVMVAFIKIEGHGVYKLNWNKDATMFWLETIN